MSDGLSTHHLPDEQTERWADVPGFPGYRVSTLGRMMTKRGKNGMPAAEYRLMNPHPDGRGYPQVRLVRPDGPPKWLGVRQVVMLAFRGPCPPGMLVRHVLNPDPKDNRLDNLAYGTQADNCKDKEQHGTAQQGERHPRATLTDDQVKQVRRDIRRLVRRAAARAATRLGVSQSTIIEVVDGKRWKHLPA